MITKLTREEIIDYLRNAYPQYNEEILQWYVEDAESVSGEKYWTTYFATLEQVVADYVLYLNCLIH